MFFITKPWLDNCYEGAGSSRQRGDCVVHYSVCYVLQVDEINLPTAVLICTQISSQSFESDVVNLLLPPPGDVTCFITLRLTGAPAQVFDVDLLLLHARRLSDQTGVVVGVSVSGTHGVLVVAAAVDVTYAPEEEEARQHRFSQLNRTQSSSARSH